MTDIGELADLKKGSIVEEDDIDIIVYRVQL